MRSPKRPSQSQGCVERAAKNSVMHRKSIFQRVPDVLGFAEINHLLCDVFGMVSNAFETFGGDNPIQTTSNRFRVPGHVLRWYLVDIFVERVHFLVARDDGAGGSGIAMDKCIWPRPNFEVSYLEQGNFRAAIEAKIVGADVAYAGIYIKGARRTLE